jgi:integrase/recombinase XerD
MVGRVASKAGIGRKVNLHLLRHTFATGLLRSCGNLAIAQKALGHALPNTTAIYTHLIDDDVKDAMQQFQGVAV